MPAGIPPADQLNARVLLQAFDTYAGAQEAVDTLSDKHFPVEHVSIVGVDLRSVETVLGRLSWGRAAVSGLAMGAWFGLLIGLFVSLFAGAQSSTLTLILLGLLYGAAFGIVFGLVSYGFTGASGTSCRAASSSPPATRCWWTRATSARPVSCSPRRAAPPAPNRANRRRCR